MPTPTPNHGSNTSAVKSASLSLISSLITSGFLHLLSPPHFSTWLFPSHHPSADSNVTSIEMPSGNILTKELTSSSLSHPERVTHHHLTFISSLHLQFLTYFIWFILCLPTSLEYKLHKSRGTVCLVYSSTSST